MFAMVSLRAFLRETYRFIMYNIVKRSNPFSTKSEDQLGTSGVKRFLRPHLWSLMQVLLTVSAFLICIHPFVPHYAAQ